MKVTTEIRILEVDGEKLEGKKYYNKRLVVKSHWDNDDWVVINIEGKEYTFDAKQLNRAINNGVYWKAK